MTATNDDVAASAPSHVPAHLVKDFAFSFGDRPHEKLDPLHQGPPIFYTPHHLMHSSMGARTAGTWVITRAADMRAVLTDPATYSSVGLHNFGKALGETWQLIPLEQDPPDHTKYRAIINPLFTQKRLNELDAKIRARAEALLQNCRKLERFDFLAEFSYPFPAGVFVDMVGMRVEDTATFLDMVHRFQRLPTMEGRIAAVREIVQFLRDLLNLRRRQPDEDLASYLLSARVDGRPLNDDELMGIFFLAFTGGLDTVASSTGFFYRHLAENPDQQQRLRDDPSLIPAAVEELFRAYSIVNITRYATRDTEIAGAPIKAGDCVTCLLSLGSRDPLEHKRASSVDFDHEKVRHLAFSAGPHHCVGAPLARREMAIALEAWTQRAPPFRLQGGASPKAFGPVVLSLDTLPLEWT